MGGEGKKNQKPILVDYWGGGWVLAVCGFVRGLLIEGGWVSVSGEGGGVRYNVLECMIYSMIRHVKPQPTNQPSTTHHILTHSGDLKSGL